MTDRAGPSCGRRRRRRRLRGVVPRSARRDRRGRAVDLRRARPRRFCCSTPETEELVFEAVVGEGEDTLLGTRFPAGTGIAGWVLATRTPLVIEDVQNDPRFASDVAEGHRIRPEGADGGAAAARGGSTRRALGSRPSASRRSSASRRWSCSASSRNQAAIAVDLLLKAREAERLLGDGGGELEVVARLATAVDALEDEQREAGFRLLDHLAGTLGG